ncbi:MAG: hypothetical protein FJ279_11920 [Planctomycetes bacterium]|nr:hypothetical protein [Planctomycetota bacterium]
MGNPSDVFERARAYFDSLRAPGEGPGRYRYCSSQTAPVIYASTYAALTRHLCGKPPAGSEPAGGWLTQGDRRAWADYLLSHQREDGLFRQPELANAIAEKEDWWGWRHLTVHALMALKALGVTTPRRFQCLEPLLERGGAKRWLAGQDWAERVAWTSNTVQNYGVMLQYARDFQADKRAAEAMDDLLDELDARQDAATGLWGARFDTPQWLSQGAQAAYHFLTLYFYDRRPVRRVERLIDSFLATQNARGGFGVALNSSACEDIDSMDPLARLSRLTDYRSADIRAALGRAVDWVVSNQNPDGGFVFVRDRAFEYGHPLMRSGVNESASFPTWFRCLSLAYAAQALSPAEAASYRWLDCPGYQFWRG